MKTDFSGFCVMVVGCNLMKVFFFILRNRHQKTCNTRMEEDKYFFFFTHPVAPLHYLYS